MNEGASAPIPEPRAAHEQAILDLLVPRAQTRIDGQLRDGDALDAKALGFLGVDAAAIALMVAVRNEVNELWWVPTGVLGSAAVFLLAAVWPRSFDVGPDTRRFYETMGGSTRLDATRQMLSELLAAVDANDKQVPAKRRLFKAGFTLLVIGLLGALAVALVD
jgi:hypothetical protein